MRLRPAFEGHRVTYVTTNSSYAADVEDGEVLVVTDANKKAPIRLMRTALEMMVRVFQTRPDVVISTGAAPGLLGILFARMLGARTIWIDSIANAERLSLSGQIACKVAHVTLTQWPHLEGPDGPRYEGAIL
jgi:UDP-N-acetylglucosamine:LPS N-acetylglucosamine transferase